MLPARLSMRCCCRQRFFAAGGHGSGWGGASRAPARRGEGWARRVRAKRAPSARRPARAGAPARARGF
eukprot:6199804-Lingulodinium_polyedra.AAC.1